MRSLDQRGISQSALRFMQALAAAPPPFPNPIFSNSVMTAFLQPPANWCLERISQEGHLKGLAIEFGKKKVRKEGREKEKKGGNR